jgi:citrate lyase subunit beta/citryl-CoA lyase
VASLLRSVLFVPGTRGDRFAKAIASGADAVVLDLEDGVDPARKDEARRTVAAWLADAPASEIARFVRVNSAKSVWLDADLAWLPSVIDHIDAIVLPKTESPREVERVASKSPCSKRRAAFSRPGRSRAPMLKFRR